MAANTESGDSDGSRMFAERMREMLNNGCSSVGVALAARIGLFKVMSNYDEPKHFTEIASALHCNQKYIRELLGLLAMSDVVDLDGTNQTYFLPHQHRPFLNSAKAHYMGMLPALMSVYGDVLECFKDDGPNGLPFSKYDTFYEWRAVHRSHLHSPEYALTIISTQPDLKQRLDDGIKVCEIGCGTGLVIQQLASLFPRSNFVGSDISLDSVQLARKTANEKCLGNITFEVQDIYKLPPESNNTFDLVYVIDVIHDLPFPEKGLAEIWKIVKAGGSFLLSEIDVHTNQADNKGHPAIHMLHVGSLFHCMPLSMYTEGGEGLGATMGKEKATEMLQSVGFRIENTGTVDREIIFACVKNK